MNPANSSVIPLPLPSQITANSRKEINQKINALRKLHRDFMATPYERGPNDFVAFLKAC